MGMFCKRWQKGIQSNKWIKEINTGRQPRINIRICDERWRKLEQAKGMEADAKTAVFLQTQVSKISLCSLAKTPVSGKLLELCKQIPRSIAQRRAVKSCTGLSLISSHYSFAAVLWCCIMDLMSHGHANPIVNILLLTNLCWQRWSRSTSSFF